MIIYQLLSPSGKSYIGQTTRPFKERWRQHLTKTNEGGFAIHGALRKYGPENFIVQELSKATTKEQLDNLEKVWIILLQSATPEYGYNMTWGGEGGSHTEETREKLRQIQKKVVNRGHSQETREKIRIGHLGLKFSAEHRKKISLNRRGVNNHFAKLTEDQVRAIRKEYIPGVVSQREIGEKYGVTACIISEIVTNKIWKHVA